MAYYYDIEGQKSRQLDMCVRFTRHMLENRTNGDFYTLHDNTKIRSFEKLSVCLPFLVSKDKRGIEVANRIIRELDLVQCQFMPLQMIELFILVKDHIEPDNIQKMEDYVRQAVEEFSYEDLDFVGVNDNFPCIATYITIIGGGMFDNEKAVAAGIARLNQLADMYRRRGLLSEYTSPSYTSGQINAIALLSERTDNAEVKELALKIEERLWIDVFGHLFTSATRFAGPYSRCYTSGHVGAGNIRHLLYFLLGNKLNFLPPQSEPFYSDIMMTTLHCPPELVKWGLNKPDPFTFQASAEFNSSNDFLPHGKRRGHFDGRHNPEERDPYQEDELYEYPSGSTQLTTYMRNGYSIGTATKEFHCGAQTESFVLLYQKKCDVTTQEDIGFAYTRYIINDKIPGQENDYSEIKSKESAFNTIDMGRKTCFQHENSALVLYKPKHFASKKVRSMRLCIIFPVKSCNGPEEIWLGERKIENYSGASKDSSSIYIRDGEVYMAVHPAILTNYGRENAVTVECTNGYVMISLYNYQGPEQDFARRGFLLTANGFAFEVRDAKEYDTFGDFRKQMSMFELNDQLHTNPHIRQTFTRITHYKTKDVELKCEYSPVSEGIRYQMANGKLLPQNQLYATGLDLSKVPFL